MNNDVKRMIDQSITGLALTVYLNANNEEVKESEEYLANKTAEVFAIWKNASPAKKVSLAIDAMLEQKQIMKELGDE